jgi:uncharacterized membrane protein YfcA
VEASLSALPSLPVLAAVFAIVTAAAVVQAGLGMGFGIMAAPLLALVAPQFVPVPCIWMGFFTAAWTALAQREGIVWTEVGMGALGRTAGVAAGVSLLAALADTVSFSLIFGLMVGAAVLISVLGRPMPFTRPNMMAMAALSGVMGTITSVGAPPMALVYQGHSPRAARPTLAGFFAVGCLISLAGLHLAGFASMNDLALALLMLPPLLAGLWIATRLQTRFDSRFRPFLLAISGGAAVLLIARGLT